MPSVHHLLLIDDDEHLAPPLAAYLRRFDFTLEAALTPSAGFARLAAGGVDAVVLDVMLPEMDGFAVCRQIRQTSSVPVLMLTARGELSDKVVGLELGADDYLPKPFEPRELAARLQTILRRARPAPATTTAAAAALLQFDGLQIDLARRAVLCQGQPVELTGTEFELLVLLARAPQRVFHRDEILNHLRGRDAELYTRAVDLLVSRLRRKLAPLEAIKTLRNAGYALALAPRAAA
ncbi:response regulator transcription factor [Pseudaquabacterium pictum]|uniref:DNA-binding response regulator n=1 Tax=Pseudaquabacterium pictum TaxID=2315236 RepID=A0A480ARR6_9BURK|nr:DNA-binding response regulator [Rubrivivax pictus]